MVAEFVLYGNRTKIFKSFVSASFLHVISLSLCRPAIIFVLFVVRRTFVLSFSLHIRPCSLLPLLPLFFACCCFFFCASPFSFCFPCFSLLLVRALLPFFCCFLACCCCFSCASPFSFCFTCFSLLFVRALCLFLLLSALLFNDHRKPALCPTAPRTART